MRASKLPFRNFEYNIRTAEALARLDGYLEDLLHRKGKDTLQPLFEIPSEMMRTFGMDKVMNRIMNEIAKSMKKELQSEFEQKGKEYYERAAQDYLKRLEPRLQKIADMFEDLGLLMDQTLLEQALVAAVSAFEVYLRELAVSVIMLNLGIRRKFHDEINKMIDAGKLEEYNQDAKRAQGEIVADLFRLDTNRIRSLLKRLIGLDNVFASKQTELKVRKIFETRHIIIHRGGLTDPKFKKVTKFRGRIGKQIKISRKYVLSSIRVLRELSQEIETHIHPVR